MHKKLIATLAIAIFLVSTFAIVAPAQATFTLGNMSGTSPYEINNFDPHVAGPIGYVWPGSGQAAYNGAPCAENSASDNCAPGYQAPYPAGHPPGAPSTSWYQLEGDTYAPFGAILTSSTGDLIFGLNATGTPDTWCTALAGGIAEIEPGSGLGCAPIALHKNYGWDVLAIMIPPEFLVKDSSQIVTTLTNNYANIWVGRLGPDDRYAPGWTMVLINTDAAEDGTGAVPMPEYYNHQYINFTGADEWYYVRINGVTAPSIAGRYFFKMFLYSSGATGANQYGVGPTLPSAGGAAHGENPDVWVPPQNWPVMLVKGEVDPAIITGTLRYGGYNATLYQAPIAEAGQVWAHMTMRLDPYTGAQRPDLPTIDAQAYLNATANGHYELEGMAPGIYDVYAEAAGYPQALCESGVTVLKGQSLHFDCFLQPGPVIHGNVFTKHQFGDEPWPQDYDGGTEVGQYMKIEIYDSATLSNIPDPSAGYPVSWSPLPCTAGGQEKYYGRRDAQQCGDPRTASAIAFPWHEYSTVSATAYNEPTATPDLFNGKAEGYSRDVAESNVCPTGGGYPEGTCSVLTSDPEGVGPPQTWFVAGGTTTPFHFEFGLKGQYGAPRDLSGEVPQVYATWINGLTPGRYYVRAWTFRYVQTALDGATFQEYYFDITPNEWAGDVTLPIDVRLSSWVNKTVYFHDTPSTITTSPVHTGAGFIYGNLQGADGHVYAANVTNLGLLELPATKQGILPPFTTPGAVPYYYSCTYNSNGNGRTDEGTATNTFVTGEPGAPSVELGVTSSCITNELNRANLNANSLATGEATIQFWGINDTWGGENSGIPSGTYTPNVGVEGYYSPTPPEQVSVTLSGSPTSISDHLFLAPGFNVSVYSIDWERPRVSRDWVWSGCQDAGAGGYGTLEPGNFANDGKDTGCAGSEIDVGFYPVVNGTAGKLTHAIGDTSDYFYLPTDLATSHLYQGPQGIDCVLEALNPPVAYTCTEMDGGGRNVLPGYQLAHDAFFGEAARYAYVGGYTAGKIGSTTATKLLMDSMFTQARVVWPMYFSQGQYNLAAYTYGYIQDKDFTAYAQNGQVADIKINLIIGVNITLDILFKKESIITGTPFNMSARVRVFNDQNQIVAEWMSSEGTYEAASGSQRSTAIAANGALPKNSANSAFGTGCAATGCTTANTATPSYPFTDPGGLQQPASGLNGYNYVPYNTTLLHVLMAGLAQQPPAGGFLQDNSYFADPLLGGGGSGLPGSPIFANACDFNLVCFPAPYAQYPFPYSGIAGSPDYTGGWTAEVDFVPWYSANAATPQPASAGAQSAGVIGFPQYYTPVNGLLMGESYHIIPGTTALSGISLTEDTALNEYVSPPGSAFVGHSMAANHLGPYSQEGVWQIAGTHNSGEASAIFEVDLNGFISGNVLAFTWSNEFRTLSWGAISVTGASGATFPFYTYDGIYQAFLPTGTYTFAISAPGYAAQSWTVSISPGETGSGQNVYLEQSNIPVPEFSGVPAAIVAFAALAASVYLLKRRRK